MLSKKDPRAKMTIEDARRMYIEMEKEIVLQNYHFPEEPSSDGYYHIWVKDREKGRRNLKAKTLETLKEKVYKSEVGLTGTSRKSFKQVFDLVKEEKLRYVKDEERKLSVKNTIYKLDHDYDRYFTGSDFEQRFIDDISKKDVEDHTYKILVDLNLKKKAFLSYRGILKAVFKLAFEEYLIIDNVYDRVDFNKYSDMLVRDTPIEQRVHTQDEVDCILYEIHKSQQKKPIYFPAYALELQIIMGLRRGEVPPLMWEDINDAYILISKEQLTLMNDDRKELFHIVNHTKTWKDRKFPVTKEVSDFLKRLKDVHMTYSINSPYLFPDNTDSGVISNYAVYGVYRRACKKYGIKLNRDCIKGTHSFRRNAITDTVNKSGGNMLIASKLYGNTPTVANKHYYEGLDLDNAKQILEGNQG